MVDGGHGDGGQDADWAARLRRFGLTAALVLAAVGCGSDTASTPTFDGDCGRLGGPAALVAMDLGTGRLLWQRTIGDAVGVATSGSVVSGTGGSGATLGVDMASGDLLWCADLGRLDTSEGNIVSPGFANAGTTVATMTADGDAVGLEPETGDELWRTPIGIIEGAHLEAGPSLYYVFDGRAARSSWIALDATTGEPLDNAPTPPDGTTSGSAILVVEQPQVEDQQVVDDRRQVLDVKVLDGGNQLWARQVPGFVAELHDDSVVVIDQTGGTGTFESFESDTRVTAYDLSDGDQRWQVALPGTSHLVVEAGDLVLVPVGAAMFAIERATGEIAWETDYGTPGRGGRYSEDGYYQLIRVGDAKPQVVVGMIVAQEPYRD